MGDEAYRPIRTGRRPPPCDRRPRSLAARAATTRPRPRRGARHVARVADNAGRRRPASLVVEVRDAPRGGLPGEDRLAAKGAMVLRADEVDLRPLQDRHDGLPMADGLWLADPGGVGLPPPPPPH